MAGALDGLHVLDLTQGDGAPFCAMQLGDGGADVVKVEPVAGDWSRRLGPPFDHEDGSLYLSQNRNKLSVALDLERPEGRAIVRELAKRADVLVHNFPKAADAARLGLDYATLERDNPRLVYCDISTLGRTGPEADIPQTDFTMQARAGIQRFVGQRGEEPVRFGSNYIGVSASMYAMQAILAALFWRKRSGQGQSIETSYLSTAMAGQQNYLTSWSDPDEMTQGSFYTSHLEPPSHGLETQDIRIEMGLQYATDPNATEHLLEWLGLLDRVLAENPSLKGRTIGGRGDQVIVMPYIAEGFKQRNYAELSVKLDELGMMFAPIHNYGSMLADPGVLEQGVLTTVQHPVRGETRQMAPAWTLDGTPSTVRLAPPLLGEHTDEVLRAIGYDAAKIAALRADGVIR